MVADGIDRMKTAPGPVPVIAVGGGHFLVGDGLPGVAEILRPPHASVANAVGAAIAQIGAQLEQIVDYDTVPREDALAAMRRAAAERRSEEHTSELQSLMRISYAVFCLKKKKNK